MNQWIRQYQSDDLHLEDVVRGRSSITEWFDTQYRLCKISLERLAIEDGISPNNLTFELETMQQRWDVTFIITAKEVCVEGLHT